MEFMAKLSFVIYFAIILGGGVMAVGSRSLVRALTGLISALIGVAGMYMLLNSPFMAFMQILIYVGAVAVLIFFAVMLCESHERGEESKPPAMRQHAFTLAAITALGSVLSWLVLTAKPESTEVPVEVPLEVLGQGLLENYFLAFELISVVLLVAMSGAVLLTWERRGRK